MSFSALQYWHVSFNVPGLNVSKAPQLLHDNSFLSMTGSGEVLMEKLLDDDKKSSVRKHQEKIMEGVRC